MNRSVKYKIWDSKENKFLTKVDVEFVHKEISWGDQFYLEVKESMENYDPTRYSFITGTELLDKNNKEIFEGDIVSMYLPPMKKTVYVEVKFKDGIFYPFGQKGDLDGNYAWESVDCEIAGNIFENPDLTGPPKSN